MLEVLCIRCVFADSGRPSRQYGWNIWPRWWRKMNLMDSTLSRSHRTLFVFQCLFVLWMFVVVVRTVKNKHVTASTLIRLLTYPAVTRQLTIQQLIPFHTLSLLNFFSPGPHQSNYSSVLCAHFTCPIDRILFVPISLYFIFHVLTVGSSHSISSPWFPVFC